MATASDKSVAEQPAPAVRGDASRTDLRIPGRPGRLLRYEPPLIGVVVGELVAAQAGVGLMMARAGATFQTSKVFAGLIIVAGTGIVLTGILQRIERRFQSWRPQNNQ